MRPASYQLLHGTVLKGWPVLTSGFTCWTTMPKALRELGTVWRFSYRCISLHIHPHISTIDTNGRLSWAESQTRLDDAYVMIKKNPLQVVACKGFGQLNCGW